MDDAAFDSALIAAAFQLAAEQGWRRVSVVAAARAAGLPLARARERFPGRAAILLRFGRLADQAALAEAPSEGPVRDRLFDLLMRRIDALQTHRAGVLALLRALPAEPPTALLLALATRRSMRWMLEAAGIPTRRHSWRTAGEGPAGGLALDTARLARRRRRGPGGDHGGARCGAAPRRAGGRMARLARTRGGSAAGGRRDRRRRRQRGRPGRPLERRCAAAYQGRAAGGAVMATRSVATVFGGSGFIGRYIVKRLAHKGFVVRVAVRDTERALFLKPMGAVGQVVPLYASLTNEPTVHRAVDGADLVVNTVGILAERRSGDFQRIHAEGAGLVGAPRRGRRRRASGAHLGDRRRSRRRQPLRRDQGHRRGDAARGVPHRDDPAPVAGVRPGGRAVQPLRRNGAPVADHAGDLRRYAIPAGLCRRRGRCGDGRIGADRMPPARSTNSAVRASGSSANCSPTS